MTLNFETCSICRSELKYWIRKHERDVYKCENCRHITVPDGLIRDKENKSIYETDNLVFESDEKIQYYFSDAAIKSADKKVEVLNRIIGLKGYHNLLDIGANYGHFLSFINHRLHAEGIEISPRAVSQSIKMFNVQNQVGDIDLLYQYYPEKKFDIITLWDVFEHLEHPSHSIIQIKKVMKDEAYLVFSTPDSISLISRLLGRNWYHIDPIQHLNIFNRKNIELFLSNHGFSTIYTGSIGHYYKFDYILNKLIREFSSGRILIKNLPGVLKWLKTITIYIKASDVMLLVCKQNKP